MKLQIDDYVLVSVSYKNISVVKKNIKGTAIFDFTGYFVKIDTLFSRCKIIADHSYYQEIKLMIYILTFKAKTMRFYYDPFIY